MKYLYQLAIILLTCLISELLHLLWLPFYFPSNVLSMTLTLALLYFGILKESHLAPTADFILKHVTFFFVPLAVSIIRYTSLVQNVWFSLLLINLFTFIIGFVVAGWAANLMIILQKKLRLAHD